MSLTDALLLDPASPNSWISGNAIQGIREKGLGPMIPPDVVSDIASRIEDALTMALF